MRREGRVGTLTGRDWVRPRRGLVQLPAGVLEMMTESGLARTTNSEFAFDCPDFGHKIWNKIRRTVFFHAGPSVGQLRSWPVISCDFTHPYLMSLHIVDLVPEYPAPHLKRHGENDILRDRSERL